MDITTVANFDKFIDIIKTGGLNGEAVSLVLGCVDNFGARIAINRACAEIGQTWFESGVSENAVSGHIQYIQPGYTACFECAPPLIVASEVDERTLKREGVCAASLPTTMGMVAGMLVQNALKYLLDFGTVAKYLGYNALSDFFPSYEMKPNPACSLAACQSQQKVAQVQLESMPKIEKKEEEEQPVVHEEDFGICVVDESVLEQDMTAVADGLRREYEAPAADPEVVEEPATEDPAAGQSLEDLMAQLKSA